MKMSKQFCRLCILVLLCAVPLLSQAQGMKIMVFAVESGDSTLIIFPTGKTMLVDTGSSTKCDDYVIPFMERHDIDHFDYYLETHGHQDHNGGLPALEAAGYIDGNTTKWDNKTWDYEDTFTIEETDWFISNDPSTGGGNDGSTSFVFEWNGFRYSHGADEGTSSMTRMVNEHPEWDPVNVRNTAHHGYGPNNSAHLEALSAELYIVSCSDAVKGGSDYNKIVNAAAAVGGDFILTDDALPNNGDGHVYMDITSGSDWGYTTWDRSATIPNFFSLPPNSSQLVSHTIPDTLLPGETTSVDVTMKNTGTVTWTSGAGYKLGTQNPQGNTTWTGGNRIALPHNVAPNNNVTFTFDITAPANPAVTACDWKMIEEGIEWFGATAAQNVDVTFPLLNLVQNPSFELDVDSNSRPDSWGTDPQYSRSNEQKTDGTYSAKGSGTGSIGGISQTMAIDAGKTYTLKVKAKFLSAGGAGKAYFDTRDVFDPQGTQFTINPDNNWVSYEATFDSGTETSVELRTYTSADFAGSFYVDEVSLTTPGVYEAQNYAPTFTSSPGLNADVGSLYTYNVVTDDADGDTVTLTVPNKPGWLTLSGNTLSGTPVATGSANVTLRADDGTVTTDQAFTISISSAGNDAPVISSTPENAAIQNQLYSYTLIATDADGDTLTYSAPTKPGWLTLAGNVLSGTPTALGLNAVTLSVSDGTVSVDQDFNVMVFEEPVLGVNMVQNPSFETGDGTAWNLSEMTVVSGQASHGTYSLKAVGDGIDTVIGNPRPSSDLILELNTDYVLNYDINYVSGTGTCVVRLKNMGSPHVKGIVSSPTAGWESKTVPFNSTSNTTLRMELYVDGTPSADFVAYLDNFSIAQPGTGNIAPAFTSTPVTDVDQNALYSYTLAAADAEGDPLTFIETDLPSWLSINAGVLTGTPTVGGDVNVTVSVSDGTDTVDQPFTITVNTTQGPVPEVVGMAQGLAEGNIIAFGLTVGNVTTANSDTVSAGDVISQNPVHGTMVDPGTPVDLVVSLGPTLEGYDAWADQHQVGDGAADADGDGRKNIYEYALGGDPTNVVESIDPTLTKVGNELKYSHKLRKDDPNLIYTVETCADLTVANWTDAGTTPAVDGTGAEYDDVSHTIPTGSAQTYIRLKIEN